MQILPETVLDPKLGVIQGQSVGIVDGKLYLSDRPELDDSTLSLPNALVLPGLINGHDHLKYSWPTKVGNRRIIHSLDNGYNNVYEWLEVLYDFFDKKRLHGKQAMSLLYKLGIYKQIFSGVTTVIDHSRERSLPLSPEFQYVSIPQSFKRELVVFPEMIRSNHNTMFADGIESEFKKATQEDVPFLIHAAEGSDLITAGEINALNQMGAISKNTVLVHCINADDADIRMIANAQTSVVWCPHSSHYVIGHSANIPKMIQNGINISIGTDSSCSGSRNLLDEIRFGRKVISKSYEEDLSDDDWIQQVTLNPAKAMMLEQTIGSLANGKTADLLILDHFSNDPYESFFSANTSSIIALIHEGKFVFGDEKYLKYFDRFEGGYSKFSMEGRRKVVAGNPRSLIQDFRMYYPELAEVQFSYIPKELQQQNPHHIIKRSVRNLHLCGV